MEFYSIERILKCKATMNILLGQRSNGKSYSVKRECVQEAFLGMGDLIYLRRWSLETKNDDVTDYFADCPVKDITGGQYDLITVYRSRIYLANNNEGDIKRGPCIGRTAALTAAPHLKSVIERGKYKNIIYEEFCTDGGYLPNEPDKLQQFIATVFGVQYSGRVWLIGNTVSRVNPYFSKWNLGKTKDLKPGQIDQYLFKSEDGSEVSIAVEFCSSIEVPSGMFFGNVAKNITTGVWETEEEPQIPEEFKPFKVVYSVGIRHTDFYFILKAIKNKLGQYLILCAPAEEEDYKKVKRKLSDQITGDPLETAKLIVLTAGDKLMGELFRRGKMVYANNLTGADFKAILKDRGGIL